MTPDFENPNSVLASLPAAPNLKEREDWTRFRTLDGLTQRAGVSRDLLPRLVVKELADDGLDTGGVVKVGELPDGRGYYVDDDGPGIGGTPERIAYLFSISRPMMSSKYERLPNRGAVGNGLRVVAGAVLASGGALTVTTNNRRIELRPEWDGTTTVLSVKKVKRPVGTRVEVSFGPTLPCDDDTLSWAKQACHMAGFGSGYSGKTSPWWYDIPAFHELLDVNGERPVRELVAELDGCTGARAGDIVARAGLNRATCRSVNREQARMLLHAALEYAKPVTAKRLGAVGPDAFPDAAYACVPGVGYDVPINNIPFLIEAWASPNADDEDTTLAAYVNRTPVTGNIGATRYKKEINAYGCGLSNDDTVTTIAETTKDAQFEIHLNIITPFMPIISDGKAPDLEPFVDAIKTAVRKVVRKAHRPKSGDGTSQKDVVIEHLDEVIADVSGGGEYRFNQRQLLYKLRPIVYVEISDVLLKVLKETNFNAIITGYEEEHGEIEGMYREPRGSITYPHSGETITLGTLMVEEYERPEWNFNKLVYIEKEGANEALKDNGWLERHDCSVMSSKGFSTRAARDLIDLLGEHDEPIKVFAVTDADGYGTVIFQTLQEETNARGARKIQIVHLGLHPWEAIAMGLEVETVEAGKRHKPVADYIKAADKSGKHDGKRVGRAPGGGTWEDWLQTHRVELNAMTTPQFIEWLDGKMAAHAKKTKLPDKLVPPGEVITAELDQRIEQKVRETLTERILREAGLEDQVKAAIKKIEKPTGVALAKGIKASFKEKADREWRDHIEAEAKKRTLKI